MIAVARSHSSQNTVRGWHAKFLAMMPSIVSFARFAFRGRDAESKEDAIVEAVANAFVAYVALVRRGKEGLAYPTVLARYAVAQFHAGRRVGNSMNGQDVFAKLPRTSLNRKLRKSQESESDDIDWIDATIEDKKTSVADQAAFRCDFPEWLATHTARDRQIAEALAVGYPPGELARRFNVAPGRISQLRSQFYHSWNAFHGEPVGSETSAGINNARQKSARESNCNRPRRNRRSPSTSSASQTRHTSSLNPSALPVVVN